MASAEKARGGAIYEFAKHHDDAAEAEDVGRHSGKADADARKTV